MGVEIERKFLVKHDLWSKVKPQKSILIKQAYLFSDLTKTIRLRIADDKGFITIKGPTKGISRSEFEYEIPVADADKMINEFKTQVIEKIRHHVLFGNDLWEVDEFKGNNAGLIVAEIELDDAGQKIKLPEWIDSEVSDDRRYANSNLILKPFRQWEENNKK